jgi:hypothetical protein
LEWRCPKVVPMENRDLEIIFQKIDISLRGTAFLRSVYRNKAVGL